MSLVEETIKAYEHSAEEYTAKHMDINIIKTEADFFLDKVEGDRILDAGCGPGRDLKYFSDLGYRSTGIDLMSEFVHIAMINSPDSTVYFGDMRNMDDVFADDSFDGLWSMASMLHLPREPVDEAAMTMREYSRVLRAGGTMFLSVMKGDGPDPLPASPKYGDHSKYFYSYGEKELQELVESAGFYVDDFEVQEKRPTKVDPVTKKLIGKEVTFLNVFATNYK